MMRVRSSDPDPTTAVIRLVARGSGTDGNSLRDDRQHHWSGVTLEQRSRQRPGLVCRPRLLAERLAHGDCRLRRLVDHPDERSERCGEGQVRPAHDRHAAGQLFEDARFDHVGAIGDCDRVRDPDRPCPVDSRCVVPREPARTGSPVFAGGRDDVIDRCVRIGQYLEPEFPPPLPWPQSRSSGGRAAPAATGRRRTAAVDLVTRVRQSD